jgi:hypothetical protein
VTKTQTPESRNKDKGEVLHSLKPVKLVAEASAAFALLFALATILLNSHLVLS